MNTQKFNNQTIELEINRTGYGKYSFVAKSANGIFSMHSTNSILVDAINSDEDDTNDWGTRQDAIDAAVESVLIANGHEYFESQS